MYTRGLIVSHCLLGFLQLSREKEGDKRTILKEIGLE